jgi:hypothetical protein
MAREAVAASPGEFADLLAPLLGWSPSADTVESWEQQAVPPGDVLVAAGLLSRHTASAGKDQTIDMVSRLIRDRYLDLVGVYPSRTEFIEAHPPSVLLDGASQVDALGLSLNLICQQLPDRQLRTLVESGAMIRLLFVDPAGEAVKRQERDEGWQPGQISALTQVNIQSVIRSTRDRLAPPDRNSLQVAVYDETTRFNLILVDRATCVVQPYLPGTRGVDSPTFLVQRTSSTHGLFPAFEQVFAAMWERGTQL